MSGLGKGIVTASLSLLLKSRGYKVAPTKIDMYLNVDAGTIRPQEHGEVFVTHDGIETDEDLGHYERYINENLGRPNYITTGQIYQEVIRKERAFEYEGEDVEAIPHLTDEIIKRINYSGESRHADITPVSYTHLRAHETKANLVCRLLLEKNNNCAKVVKGFVLLK